MTLKDSELAHSQEPDDIPAIQVPENCKSPSYPPKIGPGYLSQELRDGERYDDYQGVLFEIPSTRYRVAVCVDGYQWLLQQCKGQNQWISRKYFARKERLATVIRQELGDDAYNAVADLIARLPI
jgi:hypothetical protein